MSPAPRFLEFAPGIYRSPLPLAREVAAFAAIGGATVVDLTQRPRPTIERACARLGLVYLKHGLPYDFTEAMVETAAGVVLIAPRPTLVHCFHGRDRTGAVVVRVRAMLGETSQC